MLSLFNLKPDFNVPARIPNDWINISAGLKRNLNTVLDYYHSNTFAVNSNHLLVNILTNIGVSTKTDLDRYYFNVMERSSDIARVNGLTDSSVRGKTFNGIFYHEDCVEAILNINDEFDYEYAYENWRDLQPVKCLRHPVSDLSLNLPLGKRTGSDFGIAVTSIDIPLLCVQYKGFMDHERELARTVPDYVERTPMQFVRMFPIVNMMSTYLDWVIFNRTYCLTKGAPIGMAFRNHPFPLIDFNRKINVSLDKQIKLLESNKADMTMLLRNIPMVNLVNLEDLSQLPDMAKTRQVMWLLIIARLPIINWVLTMIKENDVTKNAKEINLLRKYFLRIKQNNQIITQLPMAFKEYLNEELEEIYELLDIAEA